MLRAREEVSAGQNHRRDACGVDAVQRRPARGQSCTPALACVDLSSKKKDWTEIAHRGRTMMTQSQERHSDQM